MLLFVVDENNAEIGSSEACHMESKPEEHLDVINETLTFYMGVIPYSQYLNYMDCWWLYVMADESFLKGEVSSRTTDHKS